MAGSEDYGYGGLYDRAIRALSGARDWYSERTDPNRPRQRGTGDVNLPVEAPPVEKPWYERIPDVSNIGERAGAMAVQPVKEYGKAVGGKLAGGLGAAEEVSSRVIGAAIDYGKSTPYQDVRNTGSESKPISDVLFEGLKGVQSGYDKPFGETETVSGAIGSRVPEGIKEQFTPFGRGVLGFQADLAGDLSNLLPGKAQTGLLGAALGAGPEMASAAWLPWKQFAKARNIEGLTHKLDAVSDAKPILDKGWDLSRQNQGDVLGRLGHAGYYTPEQAKEARSVGKLPTQKSNTQYKSDQKYQMPVSFEPETKTLDLRAPVPREDLDEIIRGLDPNLDKEAIDDLEFAWQDQAKYAEGPDAVTHEAVRAGTQTPEQLAEYYKKLSNDPVATDAIERLNELLTRPNKVAPGGIYGLGGAWGGGDSPMNHPRLTRKFGAVHYTDYYGDTGYERQGSIAFDPDQALLAPPETQGTAIEPPWVKAKSYQGKPVPIDVPAGKALPPGGSPVGAVAPTTGPAPKKVNPIEQAQQWAEQNIPVEPPKPKSWDIQPTYKGKPITTYEMGTLNELAARGGPLTKEQQKKLAIIKEYEGGYYAGEVTPAVEIPDKVDVFDPGSGKSFGTFDSQAQADLFINSHPQGKFLDSGPHDPDYMAGKTEFPASVTSPENPVPTQIKIASSDQATIQKFIDDFDDPYSQDANLMSVWGKLTPDLQAAVKEARPDIANDLKNMSIPGYPMSGGPPAPAPAKKVLGAKAQGGESMGVKTMQISLKNDEADDILLVWDNLPPKDQIYVKNAMPDEYQKIMDFKAEQQADADFDFAQQGGDEALDVDWETAGKLPAVEAPPAAKTLDDIIYELEHSGFSYDEAVELAPQILKEQGLPSALPEGIQGFDVGAPKPAPEDIYGESKVWGIPDDIKADLESAGSGGYNLKEKDASLAGMHPKDIYSRGGQDYIFKPSHGGPEFVPHQEKTANDVATLAGMYPIEVTVEKLHGKTGTMQPMIGNRADWPSLRSPGQKIEKLTTSQLKDIIKNHPVDWLTANHDAHRGQWLITPQGVIEIDRGQAFKYFGTDKLDPNYNPNQKYGEEPSIYGGILKLWKEGKLPQLDQKDIEDAVRGTASKISQNGDKVITELGQALERAGMNEHLPELYRRFNNVEEDILGFWKK